MGFCNGWGWHVFSYDTGTGEGLKAALICKKHKYAKKPLSDERLFDAVNILIEMQNDTGGYA